MERDVECRPETGMEPAIEVTERRVALEPAMSTAAQNGLDNTLIAGPSNGGMYFEGHCGVILLQRWSRCVQPLSPSQGQLRRSRAPTPCYSSVGSSGCTPVVGMGVGVSNIRAL